MRALFLFLFGVSLCAGGEEERRWVRPMQFSGMCDASGAVAASSNLFVVANDEDNILRLYRSDQPGEPVKQFDFNAFLELRGKSLEADLEGAARIGDRAFWIGSHGRNIDGKKRPNRCRLFATDITITNGDVMLTAVGRPCKRLLEDMINDPRFEPFHFAEAAKHAPKDPGALNIEGLSATPEGHLLIGFRNPIPDGKALIIPLLNPNEVIERKPARFGQAIQLDLGGLGIRDMACHNGIYIVIAGPWHEGGPFHLYRWMGADSRPETLPVDHFGDYHPEGIIIYPQTGLQEIQIISDDGTRMINGCPCKELKDPSQRTFRSFWIVQ